MLIIKKARENHISSIVQGNQKMALETEDTLLNTDRLTRGVSALINNSRLGQYWVCETAAGEVCGQIMITYEWSDWRNGKIWWIQSVYVWPNFRRRGVFRSLLAHIESEAKQTGVIMLRLYAETRNHAAHSVYRDVGFKTGTYQVFSKLLESF